MGESQAGSGARGYTVWAVMVLGLALVAAAVMLALREPAPPAAIAAPPVTAAAGDRQALVRAPAAVDRDAIEGLVRYMKPERRAQLLASEQAFGAAVREERARRAVLGAAIADGFDQRPQVRALLQRAAEQALLESYLAVASRRAVAADFPSEEQVREAFDSNRERMKLAERTELWQVFLAFPASASEAQRVAVRERASELVRALRAGETTFAEAAARYSAHAASRARGGFMGVTALDSLRPELRERVRALPEGQVGDPVESPQGVHILKRGSIAEPAPLSYEAARAGIRQGLIRAALGQARKQLVDAALEGFAPLPSAEKLEAWRGELGAAGEGEASAPTAPASAPEPPATGIAD